MARRGRKSGHLILVINPGSTSTKLALFRGARCLDETTLEHAALDLRKFRSVAAQEEWRAGLVRDYLAAAGLEALELSAAVGRGGLLAPLSGGTYRVGSKMKRELRGAKYGSHASNPVSYTHLTLPTN